MIYGLALLTMTGCSGIPGMIAADSDTTEMTTNVQITETEQSTTENVSETEEQTIENVSDGASASTGQEATSADTEEQPESVDQSETVTEEQTTVTEEQTETPQENADYESDLISSDELCDGYWTQYSQQNWLIKFASDGTAKVYNMIGIIETAQGNSLSGAEIVSDVTYSFDGSILTLNGYVNGNTVTLVAHTQDDTPGYMTDKQRGAGNVFFYEDGFDSSDPMGEPVVIGKADTSDSMVAQAVEWVESQ